MYDALKPSRKTETSELNLISIRFLNDRNWNGDKTPPNLLDKVPFSKICKKNLNVANLSKVILTFNNDHLASEFELMPF